MRALLDGTQRQQGKKKRMTDEAQMNIECDSLAGETTQAVLEGGGAQRSVLLDLTNTGSRAILKIQREWIKSRYAYELYSMSKGPDERIL